MQFAQFYSKPILKLLRKRGSVRVGQVKSATRRHMMRCRPIKRNTLVLHGDKRIFLAGEAADSGDDSLIAIGQMRNHHVELIQADSGDARKRTLAVTPPMVTVIVSVIFAAAQL